TGVQSGNSGWYDTREPYRELRVPSDDAASGDEWPAGLGGVAAGRAVAAIRGHGHGRARVLRHSGRQAVNLHQLGIVDVACKRFVNSLDVHLQAIAGKLDAIRQTARKVFDEI